MRDPLENIRPAVRALKAYDLKPHRTSIKVNQNENPYDMPEAIKSEVASRIAGRQWTRYPDFVPTSLLESLATLSGWRADGVLAGNGSNELIQAIMLVMVEPDAGVLLAEPTFTLYRQVVTILGGKTVGVPLTPDLTFDLRAISERAAKGDIRLIIICSPNNPTGCVISNEDLGAIARGFDGIVVVDEAYHEFSATSAVPLLADHPNLVILRTFSKAMAMAGLRVGYMLSSPELCREIHKATLPYNLGFFSATAAEVACEQYELLRPNIQRILDERARLFAALQSIPGLTPVESHANFILLRTKLPPKKVFEELLRRDILIRDVSGYPMLADCVRVSVGSEEENDKLIAALGEMMAINDAAAV